LALTVQKIRKWIGEEERNPEADNRDNEAQRTLRWQHGLDWNISVWTTERFFPA
jgi:hypothetical protein